jgi:hypothetical protein
VFSTFSLNGLYRSGFSSRYSNAAPTRSTCNVSENTIYLSWFGTSATALGCTEGAFEEFAIDCGSDIFDSFGIN